MIRPPWRSQRPSWAHLGCHFHQFLSYHPQVAQCKQRHQLGCVLGQPSVADLHIAELTLDHSKRVLHSSTQARLGLFHPFLHPTQPSLEDLALTTPHRHVPTHLPVHVLRPLLHGPVARITQNLSSCPCSSACAWLTSLTLAAVPATVCTRPLCTSTPMCAFMPKNH